jgi:aminomethyltransferase
MGYPLYGHELDEETTPPEAGLKNFVKPGKDFIGKEAIARQIKAGVRRSLVGFEMAGAGIARSHYGIKRAGRGVGEVTSGIFSPSLKRAIGLAYVEPALAGPGTEIEIEIRKRLVKAFVTELPFYHRRASAAAV